jgi:hypothetical protein
MGSFFNLWRLSIANLLPVLVIIDMQKGMSAPAADGQFPPRHAPFIALLARATIVTIARTADSGWWDLFPKKTSLDARFGSG